MVYSNIVITACFADVKLSLKYVNITFLKNYLPCAALHKIHKAIIKYQKLTFKAQIQSFSYTYQLPVRSLWVSTGGTLQFWEKTNYDIQ